MPLYEYKCKKCGHRFEKIESFSASPSKKCPKCGAVAARMASAPAIQFKGSGWYVTDYAGKSAAKTSGESSDGGDSKPAEKSEAKSSESKSSESKSTESKSTGNEGSKKRKK